MRNILRKLTRHSSSKRWMPSKFDELAVYNAEVHRGIMHTFTKRERMIILQSEFDAWSKSQREN